MTLNMNCVKIVTIKVENKGSDAESRWSASVNTIYIHLLNFRILKEIYLRIWKWMFIAFCVFWKEILSSDGKKCHGYQQNEQLPYA